MPSAPAYGRRCGMESSPGMDQTQWRQSRKCMQHIWKVSYSHYTEQISSTASTTGHPVIRVGAVLYVARMAAFLSEPCPVHGLSKSYPWKSPAKNHFQRLQNQNSAASGQAFLRMLTSRLRGTATAHQQNAKPLS